MRTVLGIDVDDELLALWRGWFAPGVQTFDVSSLPEDVRRQVPAGGSTIPLETLDTFMTYGRDVVALDRPTFDTLPREVRRALLGTWSKDRGTHRVWWPETLADKGDEPVVRYVERGCRPSQHTTITASTWRKASAVLPGARLAPAHRDQPQPPPRSTPRALADRPVAPSRQWPRERPHWLVSGSRSRGCRA